MFHIDLKFLFLDLYKKIKLRILPKFYLLFTFRLYCPRIIFYSWFWSLFYNSNKSNWLKGLSGNGKYKLEENKRELSDLYTLVMHNLQLVMTHGWSFVSERAVNIGFSLLQSPNQWWGSQSPIVVEPRTDSGFFWC